MQQLFQVKFYLKHSPAKSDFVTSSLLQLADILYISERLSIEVILITSIQDYKRNVKVYDLIGLDISSVLMKINEAKL